MDLEHRKTYDFIPNKTPFLNVRKSSRIKKGPRKIRTLWSKCWSVRRDFYMEST